MMSHINKGDVHAYLDGALGAYPTEAARHVRDHLDACTECAQLLADERRLRQEASSILAESAQGAVELDPFEELLARAATPVERTERTRPAWGRRTQMLGWAATIVISIGSGWMARELSGPRGDVARAIDARQDQQDFERDNVGRLTEAESPGEPPGTAEAVEVVEAVEANRVGGVTGGGAAPGSGFDDDAVLDQVQAPRAERELSAVARDLGPTSLSDELRSSAIPSAPTPTPTPAQPQDPPDVGALAAPTSQRSFARPTPSTLPFLVPGLPIRDVRLSPRADGPAGGSGSTVVVTQELADGRVVELQFVPQSGNDPGIESALRERREIVDSALPEGWALAVREVPGGVAILSGPLTEPELADLLDRALGVR